MRCSSHGEGLGKRNSLWARHSFARVDFECNARLQWMMEELMIHASSKDRNSQSHTVRYLRCILTVMRRYHDMGFRCTDHLDVKTASHSKASRGSDHTHEHP